MDLVNDVDLVAGLARRVLDVLNDLIPHIVNARLRGGIHLNDVHTGAIADADAQATFSTGLRGMTILGNAVEGTGEQAGGRGLAAAARTVKQVGVRDPSGLEGILQ